MLRVLVATFKPILQQCRLRKFVAESREWFYFLQQNLYIFPRFTGPRETCFAARDVNPGDSRVILFIQIRSQYSRNFQQPEQLARCCYPFYHTFRTSGGLFGKTKQKGLWKHTRLLHHHLHHRLLNPRPQVEN